MQEKSINIYVAGIVLLLIVLLQTHFLPAFLPNISQFVPDLTLLLVIIWSLMLPWSRALWLAFVSGLVLDLFQVGVYPFGLTALLFSFVAFGLSFVGQSRYQNTLIQTVPVTVVSALAYRILFLLALKVLGYNVLQLNTIVNVVLPVTVIDGALMILFLKPVRALTQLGIK